MSKSMLTRFGVRMRGLTLVELMVTLAIVAVLGTLAAPQFQRTMARSQLSSTATALASSLMQARSEAIRTNYPVYVSANGGDWAQGWTVFVDINKNASYNSGSDTLVASPIAVDDRVAGTSTKTAFGFDATGFLLQPPGNGCVVFTLRSNPWSESDRQVVVALSGRVRVAQAAVGASCQIS